MGWAAVFGRLDPPAFMLYAGSILWVIAYDTIYAHQDREDDALIGVRSTARLFEIENAAGACGHLHWSGAIDRDSAGISGGGGIIFAFGLTAFAPHLAWQVRTIDIDDPALCLRLFKSNRDAGLMLFAGIVVDALAGSPGALVSFAR